VWNGFSNPKAWIEIKNCDGCIIDGNDMYSGIGTSVAFTSRNQKRVGAVDHDSECAIYK